jgi:antirestriction protein
MFQDYEYVPEGLINESWISEHVFKLMEIISGMDSDTADAFGIWCKNGHINFSKADPNDLLENFQDEYIGKYESEEDFARELMEQRDDLNDFAKQYFDCEAYARDLFCSDYWGDEGHVFYNR